ncbi:MAG: hypothetical protein FWC00_03230 [Firmicutes bacterium]|nr:hypothetical protein [Bacillota bacterium]
MKNTKSSSQGIASIVSAGANLIVNPTSVTNTLTGGASNPAPVKVGPPQVINPNPKPKPPIIDPSKPPHWDIYGGFPEVQFPNRQPSRFVTGVRRIGSGIRNAFSNPFRPGIRVI